MKKFYLLHVIILFSLGKICAQSQEKINNQTLISWGSPMKIKNDGTPTPSEWNQPTFNDKSWTFIGTPEMVKPHETAGIDDDELFIPSYGAEHRNGFITTYFRKDFPIENIELFKNFLLNIRFDEGIIVYVNGNEIFRSNLPNDEIDYSTLAVAERRADRYEIFRSTIANTFFKTGNNVLAVEIHKHDPNNDINNFDLELVGLRENAAAILTRGPYLQIGTPTSMVIHWQTQLPSDGKVMYGTSPDNLNISVPDNDQTKTDHIITLTNLQPFTKYYYSIGSSTETLQSGSNNYFITSPVTGTTQPVRIWAIGDYGVDSANANELGVRDAYANYIGDKHTDVWLTMGDNAYTAGLDQEFQDHVFKVYDKGKFKNTVFWPSPGNHDYNNNPVDQTVHHVPYYNIFTLPMNAEAGGVASGTEDYYSYNYGNVHFLALDAYGLDNNQRMSDSTGPQATWIKQDLLANKLPWVIAYWHHPPYTKGSHDTDTEGELVDIRSKFLPFLEKFNIDLILNGHSHSYERTMLIKGHYDLNATFDTAKHAISTSNAHYDGSPNSKPYIKSSQKSGSGIVYIVGGSAGQLGGQSSGYPLKSSIYSDVTHGGSIAIEVNENRLNLNWVCTDGKIRDHFVMMKDVNKNNTYRIKKGDSIKLTASWIGSYHWMPNGDTTRSIVVAPADSSVYYVNDGMNVLADTNTVVPFEDHGGGGSTGIQTLADISVDVYPNPSNTSRITVKLSGTGDQQVDISVTDMLGREVYSKKSVSVSKGFIELPLSLSKGIYNLNVKNKKESLNKKVELL